MSFLSENLADFETVMVQEITERFGRKSVRPAAEEIEDRHAIAAERRAAARHAQYVSG